MQEGNTYIVIKNCNLIILLTMVIIEAKSTVLVFVIFTFLLNLINLFFVRDYNYITYKETATWIFIPIIISSAIVVIEFVLAKSKIVSYNFKDWKRLRFSIFMVFLSLFIFAYSPLVAINAFG